ncbi:MAG: class I SAM-dependent rRNA methyltransferase [Bacteroidia bacterium]|nr:class I SAM-dependent rRNA methyltransferase [Bacteroidia bacterium]
MHLPYPIIRLKKGKEKSVLQRHPWVFSGAIAEEPDSLDNGDVVQVVAANGEYLATGHFQRGTISIRCFDFSGTPANEQLFRTKIRDSIALRRTLHLPSEATNCYRLFHGEGDGLPGLIADVYGKTLVLQTYTLGMHKLKPLLAKLFMEELPALEAIYDKSADTMSKHGNQVQEDSFLAKKEHYEADAYVSENGIRFSVDFIHGQKTGFFLDQRDNRQLLKHYALGKTVLNTFCYTGGFSLAALEGGATSVHSVDSSARAMEGLEKNIRLNAPDGKHQSFTEDVMSFLRKLDQPYDILVLDPPAFAKHINQAGNAMIGYRNLNTEGLKHLRKGGLLFTFSCSQAIDKLLFRKIVFQSALQAKREVKILHQLSQPADHPVSIYHPEAEYLKGLVLYVD